MSESITLMESVQYVNFFLFQSSENWQKDSSHGTAMIENITRQEWLNCAFGWIYQFLAASMVHNQVRIGKSSYK